MCFHAIKHLIGAAFVVELAAAVAFAQQAPAATLTLTLEQAIDLAEQHSDSIDIAEAGVRRAAADELSACGRLPQLSAVASYDRALASEFENLFGNQTAAASCPPLVVDPTATTAARLAEIERAASCGALGGNPFGNADADALPFGRVNTWRFNLSFSQNLFSGGRLRALSRTAAAGRENAELELTSARAALLFNVTLAYYDAALSERVVSIAEATVNQAQSTLTIVQAGYNAGAQPEFELLRARVARDNQLPALIRQRTNRDLALLRLKQMLDLPPDASVRLVDSLESPQLPPPSIFAARLVAEEAVIGDQTERLPPVVTSNADRAAVRQASSLVRLSEAALSGARAERMPSVSLTSSYGRVAYPSGIIPENFRTNWTVGASVQVPILTGGRLRAGEQLAQASVDESRARLRQIEKLAELDSRSAAAELISARAAWEASASTLQQASRAYEIADVRYRAGVSTQLELTDSRLLLQQAALNRAQAARDLQVARARVALLPDLPLGAGQGTPDTSPLPQLPQQVPVAPASPAGPRNGGRATSPTASPAAFNPTRVPQ
jgi:outer membrane protein TolC